jgi:hypothetical protein
VEVTDDLETILDRMEQQSDNRPALPQDVTAKQLLQMVYRGEIEVSPQQFNAARVCLEYEQPKLTAVAVGHFDGRSFAAQLERCLARSEAARNGVLPRAALPPPVQPREEAKKPFTMPRRNLR